MSRPDAPAASARAVAPTRRGSSADAALARRMHGLLEQRLAGFPWPIRVTDWCGGSARLGGEAEHWCGRPLEIHVRTAAAGRTLIVLDVMGFLEKVLGGEAALEGNLYLLPLVRRHARLSLGWRDGLRFALRHQAFQTSSRARANVRSHYDLPQEALDLYLDRTYRAYSCGIFEAPGRLDRNELLRAGSGEADAFDSLEKAQWRKFRDAVDFLAPAAGDTLLDVGCGYGGQLRVALESHPFGRVVGWTHSANQVREGRGLLASVDPQRWEIHEGDYRSETRVFDHITSTGMVSHVGPRGLVPYVRQVRRRIRRGGRYVHHALMKVHDPRPLDLQLGPVFHKRFVWPGFHWFTLGTHVRALERNGFEVKALVNLSDHYAKTAAAWYERLDAQRETFSQWVGEAITQAWRIFLAGGSGDIAHHGIHVYRIYCEAV